MSDKVEVHPYIPPDVAKAEDERRYGRKTMSSDTGYANGSDFDMGQMPSEELKLEHDAPCPFCGRRISVSNGCWCDYNRLPAKEAKAAREHDERVRDAFIESLKDATHGAGESPDFDAMFSIRQLCERARAKEQK